MKTENSLQWFRRKVIHGPKLGRKLGFPTVNLHVGSFASRFSTGVYACKVIVKNKLYKGALHFGPKTGSSKPTLEIHILDFKQNIYGQFVRFSVSKKLRSTKRFANLADLRKQINADVKAVNLL